MLTDQKPDSMRRTSQFYKCSSDKKLSKLFVSQLTRINKLKSTRLTKELSKWDKSGPLREKAKDFFKRKKMMLSLLSSRTSKNFHLLTLSNLRRTMKNLRKYSTALFNSVVTTKTENASANWKEVKAMVDEMRLEFNQLKQINHFHHHKQHHKDKLKLPQPNRIFQDNL